MNLNHLNLCTSDVVALSDIFARHFGFAVEQVNDVSALLHGNDGFFLVLTKIAADSPPTYPNSVLFNRTLCFHVGFMLDAPDAVYTKHTELCDAGYHPDPITTFVAMGADWTAFYCPVGDGIAIEVNAHTTVV